jgi:predicted O-methyltransferase YrrM
MSSPAPEGWLTEDQAAMLATAAAACPPDGEIVEIGSFRGRSTIVLARAAPEGAAIVAIDPHAGNDRGPQELDGFAAEAAADRAAFERNLVAAGVRHRVRHVAEPSDRAHGDVHGTIDVLFIDGAHRYRPARADIRDWGGRVADGGTMLIHDAFSSIGVTMAIVRELLGGDRFRYVGRSRSLAEYRADLAGTGWRARLHNATRQTGQLAWFTRNVALKVFLVSGGRTALRLLRRPVPSWPY